MTPKLLDKSNGAANTKGAKARCFVYYVTGLCVRWQAAASNDGLCFQICDKSVEGLMTFWDLEASLTPTQCSGTGCLWFHQDADREVTLE